MRANCIDETGNKYGALTVIEYTKDAKGRGAWLCKCDCGNTKIVRGSDLRTNRVTHCSKSCPCKTNAAFIDETDNQYGYLTVLYKTPFKSNSNKTLWHCKCICGNECDILGESLRQGLTKSCGCKSKELNAEKHSKDLKGQLFGYLIPIEIVDKNAEGNIWRCKCICGCNREDVLVPAHRLLSNNTASCGRIKRSHGELQIENILKEYNISFKTEYSFEDLRSIKGTKLRFDFALFQNNKLIGLIEYNGQQHYQPIEYFGGQESYQQQVFNDNLKYLYCQNNNIPLLIIGYYDNIDKKLNAFLDLKKEE